MAPNTLYWLIGAVPFGGGNWELPWDDVAPGWRFWKASRAAAKLAARGLSWDWPNFTRQEYIDNADAICVELSWPSFGDLIEIGRIQFEVFETIGEREGGFPFRYYRKLLETIWDCKWKYPHLFFNLPPSNFESHDFVGHVGLLHILLTRDHVVANELDLWEVFYMLHQYSIGFQLLHGDRLEPFRCYQRHFEFSCKHSNGRCGVFPGSEIPAECPFLKWLPTFGIDV
jgi:hypothetical protein